MDEMNKSGVCKCHHHKVVPLMILLIGVAFLLEALTVLNPSTVAILWPIFLIVAGVVKFGEVNCKCC